MEHQKCLNCGQNVAGNYCGNCGQKSSTHRFTLRHLVMHDIMHGAFHLDKGFPYTLKQLFTRPGHSIRAFIEGKRAGHFNAITFLLLIIAFNLFVQAATNYDLQNLVPVGAGNGLLEQIQHYQKKYMKEFYVVTIPLASLFTYVIFKKSRLHFAEHLVLHTYREGFTLLLNTLPIMILPLLNTFSAKLLWQGVWGLVANIWVIWYFIQVFHGDYKRRLILILLIALYFLINAAALGGLAWAFIEFFIGLS